MGFLLWCHTHTKGIRRRDCIASVHKERERVRSFSRLLLLVFAFNAHAIHYSFIKKKKHIILLYYGSCRINHKCCRRRRRRLYANVVPSLLDAAFEYRLLCKSYGDHKSPWHRIVPSRKLVGSFKSTTIPDVVNTWIRIHVYITNIVKLGIDKFIFSFVISGTLNLFTCPTRNMFATRTRTIYYQSNLAHIVVARE